MLYIGEYAELMQFQSTRLSRASTFVYPLGPFGMLFQSTRLSRASTIHECFFDVGLSISIHKALASLDLPLLAGSNQDHAISIHKALASLDVWEVDYKHYTGEFQSTRLSRASTVKRSHLPCVEDNFNPQGSREPRQITGEIYTTK